MNPREIFEAWSPPGSSGLPGPSPSCSPTSRSRPGRQRSGTGRRRPNSPRRSASRLAAGNGVVVHQPTLESIGRGLALAGRLPDGPAVQSVARRRRPCPGGDLLPEVVPVRPLLPLLVGSARVLASAGLVDDAPPAFLLDADRLGEGRPITPGWFDNRWVAFATDFPSAPDAPRPSDHLGPPDPPGADPPRPPRTAPGMGPGGPSLDAPRPRSPRGRTLPLPGPWRMAWIGLRRRSSPS